MAPEFRYESTQIHSDKGRTKTQRVTIRGKNGHKEVTVKQNGKRSKTSKKKLTKKEIDCIRKCQFIPGLFKDCQACVK
jgi:transcription antitermination factor NusA-like protein